MSHFIFLASSYSLGHRERNFKEARRAAVYLMNTGFAVYSPIVHWHEAAQYYSLPIDAGFWLEQNRPFIEHCDRMYVLALDGWEASVGVSLEIAAARALGKPVIHFPPVD